MTAPDSAPSAVLPAPADRPALPLAPAGELKGRTALVTGAARGIGAAVVGALAARGARVAALDRDGDALLGRLPVAAAVFTADVADAAGVERAVGAVEEQLGPVEILVNAAGVLRTGPVLDLADDDWTAVFAANTLGVLHASRAVARRMAPRRRGSIVTVGSNAAGVPRAGMAAYAASKAAAAMLTKCLGLELARTGVRCNVVSPGSTDTGMQRALWQDDGAEQRVVDGDPAGYRVGIPLGRIAEPDDIAEAVAFLASDRARHITLHDLYVDGGATLRA